MNCLLDVEKQQHLDILDQYFPKELSFLIISNLEGKFVSHPSTIYFYNENRKCSMCYSPLKIDKCDINSLTDFKKWYLDANKGDDNSLFYEINNRIAKNIQNRILYEIQPNKYIYDDEEGCDCFDKCLDADHNSDAIYWHCEKCQTTMRECVSCGNWQRLIGFGFDFDKEPRTNTNNMKYECEIDTDCQHYVGDKDLYWLNLNNYPTPTGPDGGNSIFWKCNCSEIIYEYTDK